MSDGRSFVGSIPYARIRNLHLEGETRHDRGTAGAALRNPLLPDKAILALAVVADVAVHRPYGRVTGEMLAKRRGLSSRYLEPLLQALVHHGILRGVRGPRGGYELGRDGERISAADILRAAADEIRHEFGLAIEWARPNGRQGHRASGEGLLRCARSHQSCGPYRLTDAHQRRVSLPFHQGLAPILGAGFKPAPAQGGPNHPPHGQRIASPLS